MTKLLEQAIQRVSSLPDNLQDELAQELLAEMSSEEEWPKALENTSDKLDTLAQRAIAEFRAGKTRSAGFDDL